MSLKHYRISKNLLLYLAQTNYLIIRSLKIDFIHKLLKVQYPRHFTGVLLPRRDELMVGRDNGILRLSRQLQNK